MREEGVNSAGPQGSLKDFRAADAMVRIYRMARTGVLVVQSGDVCKEIYFSSGRMVHAASNLDDDRLGEHLLRKGRISLSDFEEASRLMKDRNVKLGKILVELCCLAPAELFRELQEQIEGIVLSIFALDRGNFEFSDMPVLPGDVVCLQMNTFNLIIRGIMHHAGFSLIRKLCPRGEDTFLITDDTVTETICLELPPEVRKVLSFVNGSYSLQRILSLSPYTDYDTLRMLCGMIVTGIISPERHSVSETEEDDIVEACSAVSGISLEVDTVPVDVDEVHPELADDAFMDTDESDNTVQEPYLPDPAPAETFPDSEQGNRTYSRRFIFASLLIAALSILIWPHVRTWIEGDVHSYNRGPDHALHIPVFREDAFQRETGMSMSGNVFTFRGDAFENALMKDR